MNYKHFSGNIFRQKTYNQQNLASFVHKEYWQLCPYFSQVYYLITSDEDCQYVFPEFAKKATATTKDGKISSTVSDYWTMLFAAICTEAGSLSLKEKKNLKESGTEIKTHMDINSKISGHSDKKSSAQDMADAGFSALGIIFRCGWLVRNQHTIFDYIHNKLKLVQQAGKVLAGWKVKFSDDYFGGYTPTLDAVTEGREELYKFAYLLLHNHSYVTDEKKLMFVAILLHRYGDFCETLKAHPHNMYEDMSIHMVVAKINIALRQCHIKEETFSKWQKQVRNDFLMKNMLSLDLKGRNGVLGKDRSLVCDPRSMMECFSQMAHHIGCLEKQMIQMSEDSREMNLQWQQRFDLLQKVFLNEYVSKKTIDDKPKVYLNLEQIFENQVKYTPEDLYMRWFYYEAPEAWEHPKKTFRALSKHLGSGLSNRFHRTKTFIKTLLLYADDYPVSLI